MENIQFFMAKNEFKNVLHIQDVYSNIIFYLVNKIVVNIFQKIQQFSSFYNLDLGNSKKILVTT